MLGPGQRLDRFVVEAEIGRGGFGTVYRARHEVLGTKVALKVLNADRAHDAEHVERLFREARAATAIGSPHIAKVVDAGRSMGGMPFLAMELLEGEDLADLMQSRLRLSIGETMALARQLLSGLGAAHAAGIVHRDLKPANVFVAREGGRVVVKILDFGISKMSGSVLTAAGMVLGTPAYMAPEQLLDARAAEPRSDLYAAAAIVYQMLAGTLPWPAGGLPDLSRRAAGD
ncbi:MAG: serine/threonine protein kinase, partial [Sandaracinaceae bacterium]|nr:serine/threonine protein kinase [Sandaracinaceae bacterium]